ncbi:hypothetical protein OsJ_01938 [Oryza sativa Japonica Group]|uniref:Uncharacterized protein n=1 Tax=Oryza sativa subsp. japonica TaxID=39947 RepID=B9EX45_ORYSJ|nr:hypothetical protein OsJ_01938 [Oryza sativa Japonica Group]
MADCRAGHFHKHLAGGCARCQPPHGHSHRARSESHSIPRRRGLTHRRVKKDDRREKGTHEDAEAGDVGEGVGDSGAGERDLAEVPHHDGGDELHHQLQQRDRDHRARPADASLPASAVASRHHPPSPSPPQQPRTFPAAAYSSSSSSLRWLPLGSSSGAWESEEPMAAAAHGTGRERRESKRTIGAVEMMWNNGGRNEPVLVVFPV